MNTNDFGILTQISSLKHYIKYQLTHSELEEIPN